MANSQGAFTQGKRMELEEK